MFLDLVQGLNASGVGGIFAYGLGQPITATILLIVVFGAVMIRTKNLAGALGGTFVIALIMYFYSAQLVSIDIVGVLGTLTGLAALYEFFHH